LGTTPDGIAASDWDRVHQLAVDIVNCSTLDDGDGEARARAALMELLDELERKYGSKPSLLATRADYVDSSEDRERLLLAAFTEAKRTSDEKNQALTADSLAHFYIEEVQDLDQGARWFGLWRETIGAEPDPHDQRELARLESIVLSVSPRDRDDC
jgi:hypothetical protein